MAALNHGMFTSASPEWYTPSNLYATLDAEFGFTLDPCSTSSSAKCVKHFTKDDDGLSQPWPGTVFMNPPYGREIGLWVAKADTESRAGTLVVGLLPARTDTAWWHDYVMCASETRFIKGRLRFENGARREEHGRSCRPAPFPSVVVVWEPGIAGPPVVSAIQQDGTAVERRA